MNASDTKLLAISRIESSYSGIVATMQLLKQSLERQIYSKYIDELIEGIESELDVLGSSLAKLTHAEENNADGT